MRDSDDRLAWSHPQFDQPLDAHQRADSRLLAQPAIGNVELETDHSARGWSQLHPVVRTHGVIATGLDKRARIVTAHLHRCTPELLVPPPLRVGGRSAR